MGAGAAHPTRSAAVPSTATSGAAGAAGGSSTSVTVTVTSISASSASSLPPAESMPSVAYTLNAYDGAVSWSRPPETVSRAPPCTAATANGSPSSSR